MIKRYVAKYHIWLWSLAFVAVVFGIYYWLGGRTTPSHVFQVTEQVIQELERFQRFENVTSRPPTYIPARRSPRHVLQKARETLLRLQELRLQKGFEKQPEPLFPVRKVTPANVRVLVEQILDGVRELRSVYGVSENPIEVPFVEGKTPTDVYGNLARIGAMLESLGAPPLQPKDVFRLVMTLISDLDSILQGSGIQCSATVPATSHAKQPADVYALAYELYRELERVKSKSTLLGDVIDLPDRKTGTIVPGDVLDLLNNILADVGEIKARMVVNRPLVLAPAAGAKIPGDVFAAVSKAKAMVGCLVR